MFPHVLQRSVSFFSSCVRVHVIIGEVIHHHEGILPTMRDHHRSRPLSLRSLSYCSFIFLLLSLSYLVEGLNDNHRRHHGGEMICGSPELSQEDRDELSLVVEDYKSR